MKNIDRYNEFACEFLNESHCIEEIEEDGLDFDELENLHYNDEDDEFFSKNIDYESDEEKFIRLIKKGLDERQAAHIVNKESERHLKALKQ